MSRRLTFRERAAKSIAAQGEQAIEAGDNGVVGVAQVAVGSVFRDGITEQAHLVATGGDTHVTPPRQTISVSSSNEQSERSPKRARDDNRTPTLSGSLNKRSKPDVSSSFRLAIDPLKNISVLDNPEVSMSRQCKPTVSQTPLPEFSFERELFTAATAANKEAMEANKKLLAHCEQRLREEPRQDELDKMKRIINDLSVELGSVRERVARQGDLLKKHTSQAACVRELEINKEDITLKLQLARNEFFSLQSENASMLDQIARLNGERQVLEAGKSQAVRRAEREGRRQMSLKHHAILLEIKTKWKKKEDESVKECDLQEVLANIELLQSLMDGTVVAEDELRKLKEDEGGFTEAFEAAQVSDFSIGKLDLPAVSEDSVVRMDVGPSTNAPCDPNGLGAEEAMGDDD
ncbi:unnamed protein product [Microthlaspi erraticum]|uniref:Uncharacterized protein n=1 Tax=Microthlaspi erraticum TaxID=1685480 RepID=A0A6D2I5D9_9BRAS|nr:unnamed protein product [Microthlaspi erraticum]